MAPELRARKPVTRAAAAAQEKPFEEEEKPKVKPRKVDAGPDLEPNIFVVAALFLAFSIVVGSFLWYKVDNADNGPFAAWVNEKFPAIDSALNRRPAVTPMFGAQAQEVTGQIKLTEEELKEFDGTDPEKPIYLAINGTIFDVSASPAFYGPGGHYNHFVGKDATRAWITECWDEPEQFTWRLDHVEIMFRPKWFDEQVMNAANDKFDKDVEDLKAMPKDMRETLAKKLLERFGTLTDREIKERRKTDKEESKAKVEETLKHWVSFFEKNDKYKVAGTVIRDESRPAPPAPCAEAMKKRPVKGGKLDAIMKGGMNIGNMFGSGGDAPAGEDAAKAPPPAGEKKGEMPQWVKDKLAKDAADKASQEQVVVGDEAGAGHDEL